VHSAIVLEFTVQPAFLSLLPTNIPGVVGTRFEMSRNYESARNYGFHNLKGGISVE
jgi:hypothetical protein